MSNEAPSWVNFKNLSTFTYPGRNSAVTQEIGMLLEKEGKPIQTVTIIGSGPIEPFITAALPSFRNAEITAVDSDAGIGSIIRELGSGRRVPWTVIEEICRNEPDKPNSDFDKPRLENSLKRLGKLDVLEEFNGRIDMEGISVPTHIRSRVNFEQTNGLDFFQRTPKKSQIILEGFVRTNINKKVGGTEHSLAMLREGLTALAEGGVYLIGDTGFNTPETLDQTTDLQGQVLLISMAHAMQYEKDKFVASFYITAGQREPFNVSDDLVERTKKRIAVNQLLAILEPVSRVVFQEELAEISRKNLLLGYVSQKQKQGTVWESTRGLGGILPERHEFNPEIVLGSQNPHLPTDETIVFGS